MGRLDNKIAIVTGAGSRTGIGAVTARVLAGEGAHVVATDRASRMAALEELAEEINSRGLSGSASALDVTDEAQWAELVGNVVREHGGLHILVNNAGSSGPDKGWDDATASEIQMLLNVNVTSQFLGIKAVAPAMEGNGGGSIVNIASAAANIVFPGVHPGYVASKGGSRLLTKSAAVDLARRGIRVNSVHPGLIETPMASYFTRDSKVMDTLLPRIPMGRVGDPREIAYAVLFLASDEASYVTGTELLVDGGYTAI
jgi:NAD(P)-dependent dehydrogenase (short-subunit alcohol dehydrogenase family)